MGRIIEQHNHTYVGKSFNQHLLSIQKRLGKVVARPFDLTVVFVGETHNTVDEKRRAAVFGNRPGSSSLLTVIERGMGVSAATNHVVVEPVGDLSPFDPRRDDGVVAQIAKALEKPYKSILILFGEDHEKKIRERMVANGNIKGMIWHFYPSFNDHAKATSMVFPPHDPRGSGFELVGMIRESDHYAMDLKQIAEGVMPKATPMTFTVLSPFGGGRITSKYALFARPPQPTTIFLQHSGMHGTDSAKKNMTVQVSWTNLKDFRFLDITGIVSPVALDLKDEIQRNRLIEAFWADF